MTHRPTSFLIALALLLATAVSAQAQSFFADDMEGFTSSAVGSGWESYTYYPSSIVISPNRWHSGSKSLRFSYNDTSDDGTGDCYFGFQNPDGIPDNLQVGCGPYIDRYFPASQRVFIRFWWYPENWRDSNLFSKIIKLTGSGGPDFYVLFESGNVTIGSQLWYDNTDSNVYYGGRWKPDTWQCYVIEAQFNDPGVTNGYVKIYQDGSLITNSGLHQIKGPSPGSMWQNSGQPSSSNAYWNYIRLYNERGGQRFPGISAYTYYDDIAVSDQPLGCDGSSGGGGGTSPPPPPPPSPPSPPNAPTLLRRLP